MAGGRGGLITRCPRCFAEDISADAHPTRVLDNGVERPVLVCRNCYRAAELEFRIACQADGRAYEPLAIRDGLQRLRDFYSERLREEQDRQRGSELTTYRERPGDRPDVAAALADVERRLAIRAV